MNNLIQLGNITPKEAGWVITSADFKASYSANLLRVFFIKNTSLSTSSLADVSTAATCDIVEATLLDATGAKLSSSANVSSAYALANLEKTEYVVAAAEGTKTDGSSSSGGGCNAGFAALSALMALAFFKKSK